MTKIDFIRGVNSRFAEIQATTSDLSLAEQALASSLERDIQAAAQKEDGPKRRLASVKAAAVLTDPRTKEAFKNAVSNLQRLGFDLEAIAASGSITDLDEKMPLYKWDTTRKAALKVALGIVGTLA